MIDIGDEGFVETIQGTRKVTVIKRQDGEVLVEFTANLLQTWVDEEDLKYEA